VRSIFMYPLCMQEYLNAIGATKMCEAYLSASPSKPLASAIHGALLQHWLHFMVIGGMPEAVSTYVQSKDLLQVQQVQTDLITAMQADFAKYKTRLSAINILAIFNSVLRQQGDKYTYTKSGTDLNTATLKQGLQLLMQAGIVIHAVHSNANGIPLAAEINEKKKRFFIFDTGLYLRLLGINIVDILQSKTLDTVNKGALAELFVGLELMKAQFTYQEAQLFYWQREALNSNAQVDFVIQKGTSILPIEVKSGTKGSMQSLYLFLKEKGVKKGIRTSMENFAKLDGVDVVPIYAIGGWVK
jgi:uncharacterized protein